MSCTHNRIKNIYYMLAYAFRFWNAQKSSMVDVEKFDNIAELCAAMLVQGVSTQIKQGLCKGYIPYTEELSSIRGKIDVTESIKTLAIQRQKLVCSFDEFSVNIYLNRIIKTTMMILIRAKIDRKLKSKLRKLLAYFNDVDILDLHSIHWNFQYDRNNQTYRLLISICYLVVKGLLQTDSDGSVKLMHFLDDKNMCRLFEKFILEYYRKEYSNVKGLKVHSPQIEWHLDDENNEMLPAMQTDVMVEYQKKILIIDAKYYSHLMQSYHNKVSIHSGNLYQIFTYVKNKQAENREYEVSGMLLYANLDDSHLDCEFSMSGNRIAVKTLDLDGDFDSIRKQLDDIANKYLGVDV